MLGDGLVGSTMIGGDASTAAVTDRALQATVTASASVTGLLGLVVELAADVSGHASASGDLGADLTPLAATVAGRATAVGTVTTIRILNGRPLNLRRGAVAYQPISV